ncbi:MAG: fatty acid desaturase [Candidatus Poseidoniales archaeon]
MSERWSWVPHLWGLMTPLFTLVCLGLGGWWMAAPLVVFLGVYPLLEIVLGQSADTQPLQEGRAHDVIVHLHAVLVPVMLVALLWRVSLDGLTLLTGFAIASAGLTNGASGIVAAHELGHRRPRSKSWWTARLTLFSVLYLHFTTEHNHTHHRHWARDVDPTSSPWGRSVYVHVLQTIPRQVRGAYRARPVDTRRALTVEALFLACLAYAGLPYLVAYLGQAAVAIYLLEFVNYLQHHGLRRGDDERPNATHAWESRHRLSRWTLMELPLHPSHHLKSSTPYQRLDVHDEAPQLPFGYYGMFWVALVPPVFSRLMKHQHTKASIIG